MVGVDRGEIGREVGLQNVFRDRYDRREEFVKVRAGGPIFLNPGGFLQQSQGDKAVIDLNDGRFGDREDLADLREGGEALVGLVVGETGVDRVDGHPVGPHGRTVKFDDVVEDPRKGVLDPVFDLDVVVGLCCTLGHLNPLGIDSRGAPRA